MNRMCLGVIVLLLAVFSVNCFAHCQVPCGIYNDADRFSLMKEGITSIEKAINEINRLSAEKSINYNQLVRWVNTKDAEADKIMEMAADYFLAQRVKLPKQEKQDEKYVKAVTLLHSIIVYAMESKQAASLESVAALRSAVKKYEELYFSK